MSTIAEEITALDTNLAAAKAAVTTAGGTVGDTGLAGLASEIATIPSGGGGVVEKDINFYDYDGTLVESWTLAELANKTALPDNPSHTGLTAQGWNWSLADLKTQNTRMVVGQMYVPTDGKTHLFVEVDADHLTPNLAIGLNGTATIDWGDGTTTSALSGSDIYTSVGTYHTYTSAGKYEVTIELGSGSEGSITGTYNYVSDIWKGDDVQTEQYGDAKNRAYAMQLKELYVGPNMSLDHLGYMIGLSRVTLPISLTSLGFFMHCHLLEFITVPSQITALTGQAFYWCPSLEYVSLPKNTRNFGSQAISICPSIKEITLADGGSRTFAPNAFTSCNSLTTIRIPSGTVSLPQFFASACPSLATVVVPAGVTGIGASAFKANSGNNNLWLLDLSSATSVPTVGADIVLSPTAGFTIKVPKALLTSFQTASGWSSYASYMVGV